MRPPPQPLLELPSVGDVSHGHDSILGTRHLRWTDEAQCADHARHLAQAPALRDATIELHGPLGAGKTTFVRHLLQALGVEGRIKSPSYAVVEPHRAGTLEISHFDFYRFDDPHEWIDAGLRDLYVAPGLKLAEWPQKAGDLLPRPDLRVCIAPEADGARDVTLQALSPRGLELLS